VGGEDFSSPPEIVVDPETRFGVEELPLKNETLYPPRLALHASAKGC
jgi:hypothetical protein